MFGLDYMRSHFTREQRYIIVAILSLFLPFTYCAVVLTFLSIRLTIKGEIQKAYKEIPYSKCFILFSILTTVVSLIYQNYLGVIIGIGFLPFLSLIVYIRKYMSPRLFELSTSLLLALSLLAAFYGFLEYIAILNKIDIHTFELIIFNGPKQRINSFYYNANYYAMMIEFFVAIAFYKIITLGNIKRSYKKFFYYIIIIFVNLFMLVLTACRTAWMAIPACILVMLIVSKHYKTCLSIGLCVCFIGMYFIINPSAFPRVDNIISYFLRRKWIWQTAIACIKDHPLFGEGSLTYFHVYEIYGGHATQHAHSVYLDPFLSYGIVGVLVVLPYIISHIKGIIHKIKTNTNLNLMALIVGMVIVVLVHGTMDYTVFFVQTGFLFLAIINSFQSDEHPDKPIIISTRKNIIVRNPHIKNIYVGFKAFDKLGSDYIKDLLEDIDVLLEHKDEVYKGVKIELSYDNDLSLYLDESDIHRFNVYELYN